jgi:hypothetical protein
VLGKKDVAALDDLYARVVWIPDGELDRLDEAARAYRQIIGAPDPPPTAGDAGEAGGRADRAADGRPGEDDGDEAGGGGAGGSLAGALEQAIATARGGQTETARRGHRPRAGTRARRRQRRTFERAWPRARDRLPTGGLPDRGVDRPPYPDEVQHARRYATRLRQAIMQGTRQIDKRTPGGRFDGRAYARGRAQQAAGRPVTTHPWRVTRTTSLLHGPVTPGSVLAARVSGFHVAFIAAAVLLGAAWTVAALQLRTRRVREPRRIHVPRDLAARAVGCAQCATRGRHRHARPPDQHIRRRPHHSACFVMSP